MEEEKEIELISALSLEPSNRQRYVDAAQYFDAIGDDDNASSLFKGILPKPLISKYELDSYQSVDSSSATGCTRIGWSPAHKELLKPPKNQDKNRNTIFTRETKECPPEYLDLLHNGTYVYNGMDKLVVDSDNNRIDNHSDINSYLSQRLAGNNESCLERKSGLSIMLMARNAMNFYHWHFDILPVLGLVEESGISLQDINQFIVPDEPTKFQLQMLRLLGIESKKIVNAQLSYSHISCDELLLPKIHNFMGLRQPRKHIDWIRSKYLSRKKTSQTATGAKKKIAIMRESRGYSNDAEVEAFLVNCGYQCVYPEKLSYQDQIELFSCASHIVAPHGAALALLAYCQPGTIVHEVYGEHVHPCFWSIASTLGLEYYNYNCSAIYQEEITNSGQGLSERARKSIMLNKSVLEKIAQHS